MTCGKVIAAVLISFGSIPALGECVYNDEVISYGQIIEIDGTVYECVEIGMSEDGDPVLSLEMAGYIEQKYDEFELLEMGLTEPD